MKQKFLLFIMMVLMLTGCGSSTAQTEGEAIPADGDIAPSLSYLERMPLDYATQYAVDYYSAINSTDNYTLLTLSDGSRFLLVPEGDETPDGLDEDITAVALPLANIYVVASASMDMFRAIGALDSVRLCGLEADGWSLPDVAWALTDGDMLYAGKYSAPDYELILSEGCDFVIENTMINHTPEVKEKLETFDLPVMIEYSSYEEHPLGRSEWVKLFGVLTGHLDEANAAFEAQKQELEQVLAEQEESEMQETPAVAFFYITTNGAVSVRKSNDYIPKMIELAGGEYVFSDLGDEESRSSSMTMQMEEFYATAQDADYLIYNSTIDGGITTIEELVAKSALLADFKAVQEGNVWCTTRNLYQESMSIGTMIAAMHEVFVGETPENEQFLYKLQ